MRFSTGTRLTLVACAAVIVLLPVAGWLIAAAFERSAQAALDSRLEAYLYALAGRIEVSAEGQLLFPRPTQELRFEEVFSGSYWQIRREGEVLATSRSLWDTRLDYPSIDLFGQGPRAIELRGPRDELLRGRMLSLRPVGLADPIELIVTAPRSEIDLEVASFGRVLWIALGSLGLMLVLVFGLQIRWGLAPLRRMERALREVQAGTARFVEPDLPVDLRKVADVMNEVLRHQENLIERGRSTAGNLAHALKTPLATMRLGIERPKVDTAALRRDLAQIQGIVEHHLARAAAAGREGGPHRRTRLQPALDPILHAVRSMYRERNLELEVLLDQDAELVLDVHDLQELAGNLLENAMKWAQTRVELRTTVTMNHVLLQVDDDGPGIPPEARERVVARGTQLDDGTPGSGLGLAIVRDIAGLYDIAFTLEQSPLGGLSAGLRLPRAG